MTCRPRPWDGQRVAPVVPPAGTVDRGGGAERRVGGHWSRLRGQSAFPSGRGGVCSVVCGGRVGPSEHQVLRPTARREKHAMKDILWSALVLGVSLCAVSVGAQPPSGALAIDERQGDQYGWAVDYETAAAAWAAALRECGAGCSVVLTFERCAAYAADQDADSTAVGWAQSYASADGARQGGAGRVQLSWWFRLRRSGVGLQRPGGRGGVGSRPGRAAADSAETGGRRLRPG